MNVLIVEDDRKLNASLCEVLETYGVSCTGCTNGADGFANGLNGEWDIILLDIMLPEMDGFEITRRLRTHGVSTPILMLTARSDTEDRIIGLDNGADYYLSKPFEIGELLACIRALVRRSGSIAFDAVSFGDLSFHLLSGELLCAEKKVRLGGKEAQIMQMLIMAQGKTVNKKELLIQAWGEFWPSEYNSLEVFISVLRKKLQFLNSGVQIRTHRKVGYSLEDGTCSKN